jgi:hypothetical protein
MIGTVGIITIISPYVLAFIVLLLFYRLSNGEDIMYT